MTFLLANWRLVLVGLLVGALSGYAMTMRIERDAVRTEYADFRTKVAEAAALAAQQALQKTIADERRKESADAENAQALAILAGTVAKLRARPPVSLVSTASASAGGPDVACFDRPIVERAYGALVIGLRSLADEGSKATVDLDTAKRWLQERHDSP